MKDDIRLPDPVSATPPPSPSWNGTCGTLLIAAFIAPVVLLAAIPVSWFISHKSYIASQRRHTKILRRIASSEQTLYHMHIVPSSTRDHVLDLNLMANEFNSTVRDGAAASEKLYIDSQSEVPDAQVELQEATHELHEVKSLPPLIDVMERECIMLDSSLNSYYTGPELSDFRAHCRSAIASWRKSYKNWDHAISIIHSNLIAFTQMQYERINNTNLMPYYQSSEDDYRDGTISMHVAQSDVQLMFATISREIGAK